MERHWWELCVFQRLRFRQHHRSVVPPYGSSDRSAHTLPTGMSAYALAAMLIMGIYMKFTRQSLPDAAPQT